MLYLLLFLYLRILISGIDRRKREKYEKKAAEGKKHHEKKKDKKKEKRKNSVGSVGDDVAPGDFTEEVPFGVTSDDPTTLRNTLQNSSTSMSGANGVQSNEAETVTSPRSMTNKIVSFDSTPAFIEGKTPAEGETKPGATSAPFSDSSDQTDSETSSDSTSDDDNKPLTRAPDTASFSKPTMPYRKIKAVGNKIHVLTQSGQAYECERYCPHKVLPCFPVWMLSMLFTDITF